MKLDELTRFDKDLSRTKLVYGLVTLCAVLALPAMYYWGLQKMEKMASTALVTDPSYKSFYAVRRPLTLSERKYQYESHAKDLWEQMWNVDKNTIDENVNKALRKADESLEGVYKEYFIEKGLEQQVKESNWSSELTVDECKVKIDTFPVTGHLRSHWRIIRPGGSDLRHLDMTFTLEDAGVSPDNPYGAVLKRIDIFDNTRFETKEN